MNPKRELRRFYEEVGEKYPEERVIYQTLRGKLRKRFVLRHLQQFQGSLLDIGCNSGIYLRQYKGGRAFGADLSKTVLQKADPQTMFLAVADAEALCFRSQSFDHLLCSEVLEHCLNPRAVFAEIFRVLKPGGTALLTTPNYKKKKPEWIELGTLRAYGISTTCEKGYYHTAYKPDELRLLALNTGLDVIECGTLEKEVKYAAKIPALFLISCRFINRLFRSVFLQRCCHFVFEQSSLWIYYFAHYSGLEKCLLRYIRSGVRSYVLVRSA